MLRHGLWAMAILIVGCGGPVPTQTATPSQPAAPSPTVAPPPADAVLLRLSHVPTMHPYPGQTVEPPAKFTLFGDRTAVFVSRQAFGTNSTQLELAKAQLSPEQANQLIAFALDEGGLATAHGYYPGPSISDADNTVFELHLDGDDKVVTAYALDSSDENAPDRAERAALAGLEARLANFETEVAAGGATSLGEFVPEAYLVTLDEPFGPEPGPDGTRPWPWDDLSPDDFHDTNAEGDRTRVLTADQAAQIAEPPLSAPNDYYVVAPDGGYALIRLRPLLPDEVAE